MNNNKNNNLSTNYKDYKYKYTGYEDYIKKHHLDKKDVKKETEDIIHDHRLKFDFNNPNQHHHDYSFNFNNPNEHYHDYSFDYKKEDHPKYRTESSVNTKKSYQQRPINNTQTTRYNYNTQTTNNIPKTNKTPKNNSSSGCLIFIIVFFFFLIPIMSFIIEIANSIDYSNDYNYEYEYENNNDYDKDNDNNYNKYTEDDLVDYTKPYDKALNSYLNAVTHLDYNYAKNSITKEELNYNDGWSWENNISSIKNKIQSDKVYSFKYEYINSSLLSNYSLEQINYKFENIYGSDRKVNTAYRIILRLYVNQTQINQYITLGKIDNTWYLIQIN